MLPISEEDALYSPGSENKGADQLCSYCTADLWLCFRICKNLVLSRAAQLFLGKVLEQNYCPRVFMVFRVVGNGAGYGDVMSPFTILG